MAKKQININESAKVPIIPDLGKSLCLKCGSRRGGDAHPNARFACASSGGVPLLCLLGLLHVLTIGTTAAILSEKYDIAWICLALPCLPLLTIPLGVFYTANQMLIMYCAMVFRVSGSIIQYEKTILMTLGRFY